ncbi:MAG: hypothetical protein HY921_10045 [Elusimicrobia bacterium]|nr:hypothetical protein [Elusimicrobiota bacterium]
MTFFLLSALAWAAVRAQAGKKPPETEMREEIQVKGKASGPRLDLPGPRPNEPLVDEVIRSLEILRSPAESFAPELEASPQDSREPFPGPPFLALRPEAVTLPHNSWTFQVFEGRTPVWETSGQGSLAEALEWDGYSSGGSLAVKVSRSYHFKFHGKKGGKDFILASRPVSFKSLELRDPLGRSRFEIATSALFAAGKAEFGPGAAVYLEALADRLRLAGRYSLRLHHEAPHGRLARGRARLLQHYLASKLLVNAKRLRLETEEPGERGAALTCEAQ